MDYRLLLTVGLALGVPVLLLGTVIVAATAMARRIDRRRAREWTEFSLMHVNRASRAARP